MFEQVGMMFDDMAMIFDGIAMMFGQSALLFDILVITDDKQAKLFGRISNLSE